MKYYKSTTKYNCGIDLHTKQMYICVMDREGNKLVHKNIKGNDFAYFLKLVEPYRHDLTVVSECCYNWYWLADACMDADIEFTTVQNRNFSRSDSPFFLRNFNLNPIF